MGEIINFDNIINEIILNDLQIKEDFNFKMNRSRGQSITFTIYINSQEKLIIKIFDYLKEIKQYFHSDIDGYEDLNDLVNHIEDIGDFPYNIEDVVDLIEIQKRSFFRYVKVGEISDLKCFPTILFSKEIKTNGSFYGIIVEEFIRGITLEDKLKNTTIEDKDLFVYDFLCQMGKNLKGLFTYGLVHRDLSPDNIMILNDEYVMIDPGVIKLEDGNLTKSRMILGKKNYASPEQYQGYAKNVTFKSDLYALGIISLEILLGYNPLEKVISIPNPAIHINPHVFMLGRYEREIEDDIYKNIRESDFSSHLLLVIKKLIQIEDRNRFDSIESFLNSLKILERMKDDNE